MQCEVQFNLWGAWFEVGTFLVQWSLRFDLLTAHMLLTVTGVSFAVHVYSVAYMRADPHLNLFVAYLSLFTFFMLVLVTARVAHSTWAAQTRGVPRLAWSLVLTGWCPS